MDWFLAKDYNMLLGSRILQGVGQAVLEFLVGYVLADLQKCEKSQTHGDFRASIADIYFTHEVRVV